MRYWNAIGVNRNGFATKMRSHFVDILEKNGNLVYNMIQFAVQEHGIK